MDTLAFAAVEYNYLETLAKTFIIPARQNQITQENIFNNAPVRRVVIATNTNSAFTGSSTENPICFQQFNLRQTRILRGGQLNVDSDTADNCRLYVTTMKAINCQDDIPSIPIDDFKDHYLLVFDLTSMLDTTENCLYPEIVGESLKLELIFTIPLENFTELNVLSERTLSVAVDKFGVVEKNVHKMRNFALQQIINRILLLKFQYLGSFPSNYVPTLENDTFAIINRQRSTLQGEHRIMIAKFRFELSFADSLG